MAQRFFYVMAGVFLLAASFHLGGGMATAQAPTMGFVALNESGYPTYCTPTGEVWWNNPSLYQWQQGANIFGAGSNGRTIVQFDGQIAMASSGEVFYSKEGDLSSWVVVNLPPGVTAASVGSWGSLKAKYR